MNAPDPKPRIILVHGSDDWYGSDRALFTLACFLSKHVSLTVLLAAGRAPEGELSRRLRDQGIETCRIHGGLLDRQALRRPLRSAVATVKGWRDVVTTARGAQAVIANTSLVAHLAAPARLAGAHWVTIHREMPDRPRGAAAVLRLYSRLSSLNVVISETVRRHNVPLNTRTPTLTVTDRVVSVVGGEPTQATERAGGSSSFAVVGRLNPLRAPHLAIDALERLLARGLDVRLHFVGGSDSAVHDEYVARLHAQARPFEDRVVFHGFVPAPADVLRHVDVVVNTRPLEPLGHVVFESWALGIPIVCSDRGGPAEHIDHEISGLLYPAGDAVALSDCVFRLLADTSLRATVRRGGRLALERVAERSVSEHRALLAWLRENPRPRSLLMSSGDTFDDR